MIVVDILIFLFALIVMIAIHEMGHFFVARLSNVLCHEFAIGLGPKLFSKRRGETRYSLRAIPLGGYAAMAGEDESTSYVAKNEYLGLSLDKNKWAKQLVLTKNKPHDVWGKVISFNLYHDKRPLYITLATKEGIFKYYVCKNAFYHFNKGVPMQIAPQSRSFEAKPKLHRFFILFAGPMMNFILALFLFFVALLWMGKNVTTNTLGTIEKEKHVLLKENGVKKGAQLISFDGKDMPSFNDLTQYLNSKDLVAKDNYQIKFITSAKEEKVFNITPIIVSLRLGLSNEGQNTMQPIIGKNYKLLNKKIKTGDVILKIDDYTPTNWLEIIRYLERDENVLKSSFNLLLKHQDGKKEKIVIKTIAQKTLVDQRVNSSIIYLGLNGKTKVSFAYAFTGAFKQTWQNTNKIFKSLGALFNPQSGIGLSDLSGPVGIMSLVSRTREQGLGNLFLLIAILSLNFGVLNLLPIPALDGGRIFFLLIESIAGRKLFPKLENKLNLIMFILLMGLMVVVLGFDIFKLI